jgi:hypothetical protein
MERTNFVSLNIQNASFDTISYQSESSSSPVSLPPLKGTLLQKIWKFLNTAEEGEHPRIRHYRTLERRISLGGEAMSSIARERGESRASFHNFFQEQREAFARRLLISLPYLKELLKDIYTLDPTFRKVNEEYHLWANGSGDLPGEIQLVTSTRRGIEYQKLLALHRLFELPKTFCPLGRIKFSPENHLLGKVIHIVHNEKLMYALLFRLKDGTKLRSIPCPSLTLIGLLKGSDRTDLAHALRPLPIHAQDKKEGKQIILHYHKGEMAPGMRCLTVPKGYQFSTLVPFVPELEAFGKTTYAIFCKPLPDNPFSPDISAPVMKLQLYYGPRGHVEIGNQYLGVYQKDEGSFRRKLSREVKRYLQGGKLPCPQFNLSFVGPEDPSYSGTMEISLAGVHRIPDIGESELIFPRIFLSAQDERLLGFFSQDGHLLLARRYKNGWQTVQNAQVNTILSSSHY